MTGSSDSPDHEDDGDAREPWGSEPGRLRLAVLVGVGVGLGWAALKLWEASRVIELSFSASVLFAIAPVPSTVLVSVLFLFLLPMGLPATAELLREKVCPCLCLALLCGGASWWLATYAEAVAEMQMWRNAGLGVSFSHVLVEDFRKSNDAGLIFVMLIVYSMPAVALLILNRHGTARLVVLSVLFFLLLWDLQVASAPEGGDRKGCVNCELPAFAHLALGFLIVPVALGVAARGIHRTEVE